MNDSPALDSALQSLRTTGSVCLPGVASEALQRWLRRRRIAVWSFFAAAGLGLPMFCVGLVMHVVAADRAGPLVLIGIGLMILGAVLFLFGGFVGLIIVLVGLGWRERVASEHLPVILDAHGVRLRGIGPIPWRDLRPPEWRHMTVKNDIGGLCTIMELTPDGRARVGAQPGWWQGHVGPRPYLAFHVPALLLPGVAGMSAEEVMHLLASAREHFVRS